MPTNRREFIKTMGALGAAQALLPRFLPAAHGGVFGGEPARKPPFRVIFSNDTTNISSCVSPYHKKGERWRPEMLEATVDEVAGHGVDAHFIQLASGQVPWYQSKVYPLAEHHKWWSEFFEVPPDHGAFSLAGVHSYILNGGDLLQLFINRCRVKGQAPFVSMRMNDMHHVEHVGTKGNTRGIHSITRFFAEHPEYRIGPKHGYTGKSEMALNWGEPAVREWIFSLVAEQCRGYDIDGFELDFMRHPAFFRQDGTTSAQRRKIMLDFICRVRAVLDENPFGRKRWLCVRIPCFLAMHDALGIDPAAWAAAGVEMFNVSTHYFTIQQTDLAKIRARVPQAFVYQEMCHSIWNGRKVAEGYDTFIFRRTTREQYQTTAHLAYANGADGVSLFNFVYYREHGSGDRGPFAEPPFDVMDHLGDKAWLASQRQHWFLAPGWDPRKPGIKIQVPCGFTTKAPVTVQMELAPPSGGWQGAGRLRLQAEQPLGDAIIDARINGSRLAPVKDTSEPFPNPYPSMLGRPGEMRGWTVPADVLRPGMNAVAFTMTGSNPDAKIVYVDLAI